MVAFQAITDILSLEYHDELKKKDPRVQELVDNLVNERMREEFPKARSVFKLHPDRLLFLNKYGESPRKTALVQAAREALNHVTCAWNADIPIREHVEHT